MTAPDDARRVAVNDAPDGMTLRDWFAGQALAGIMARMKHSDFNSCVDADDFSFVAGDSYAIADAMMVARVKEPNPERKT